MERIMENNGDISLDFHSTSAKNGHFGSSTDYIAAEHRVVRRTWGARRRLYGLLPPKVIPPTVEYMDIPDGISSEGEIRTYLRSHHGQWVKMPQEAAHLPRRQNAGRWFWFPLTLCVFGLWLVFVIDYWNHSTAYTNFFPWDLYAYIQYSNASYLISAGLPLAAFFFLCVLPDALARIFPAYRVWNKWYIAIASILLTAQTTLMLASTRFYVKIGVADLLFGYHYHNTFRKMTAFYVRSIPVFLGLSVFVWLVGLTVSLLRTEKRERCLMSKQTAKTTLWCIVLGVLMCASSNLVLSLLFAMNFRSAVAYVNAFCTHNASNIKAAMISLLSAPLVEEIAFRGIICKWLKKTSNSWIAIIISAVGFGLWHRNSGQFAYTFASGILLGFVFLRSGSVVWPMLIHFINNLVAILGYSNSSASVFGAWPAFVGVRLWMLEWPALAAIAGLAIIIAVILCICIRISRTKNDQGEWI